jgi:hypothetical protein
VGAAITFVVGREFFSRGYSVYLHFSIWYVFLLEQRDKFRHTEALGFHPSVGTLQTFLKLSAGSVSLF